MALYVKIHYGPYEAFHTTSHKPQKLKGVRDKLRRLGYRVDLNPVEHRDYCVFEISGHQVYLRHRAPPLEVFRCNIRNLQFNIECDSDPVAQRAVAACLSASDKLMRARLHFWLWSIIEDCIFLRAHTPENHWPTDVKIKLYDNCLDCAQCCGIITKETYECPKLSYKEIEQQMLYDLSTKGEKTRDEVNSGKLRFM